MLLERRLLLLEQAGGVGLRRRRRRGRGKDEGLLLGGRDRAEEVPRLRLGAGRAAGQRLDLPRLRLGREPRGGEDDGLGDELPLAAQVGRDGDAVVVEVGEAGLGVAAVVESLRGGGARFNRNDFSLPECR